MEWTVERYGSGTQIVTSREIGQPHYYVYGPRDEDEDQAYRNRCVVCDELCAWLNGGERPAWLSDLKRESEGAAFDLDGTLIYATGPTYDADPPKLDWREVDTDEAKAARARLIDRLFGIRVAP